MTVTHPSQDTLADHRYGAGVQTTYQLVKRVCDVAFCLLILPIVAVAIVLIALAIVLDSPGPALFVQNRVGKDRRQFRMLKFRTMQHNHDSTADRAHMQSFVAGQLGPPAGSKRATYKPSHDDKITRVGHILRRSSLDELPQIINVLRGDMSLIGPRPNVAWEVDKYADWHYKRLAVRPGISGWAQVHGRSAIPFETIVHYDVEYVDHCCLWMDLRILWLTIRQVLLGNGAG